MFKEDGYADHASGWITGRAEPGQAPLFTGEVSRHALVGEGRSAQVRVALVRFAAGGRNVPHRHSFDQVLVITEGEGIVADEQQEHTVRPGDVVLIPAGEHHWHGATGTTPMAHLAIGTPGRTEVVG